MEKTRYIPTYCLQVSDTLFVPFWELQFVKTEDCGNGYKTKDSHKTHFKKLTECYWDLKEQKIIFGFIKDVYPKETEFSVNETVYVEKKHNSFMEDKIVDIIFNEYETKIVKVKKLEPYELKWYFSPDEISTLNPNDIYEIRTWKPFYKLASNKVIQWEHEMKHKAV